jgi:4-hydroxy-tetrahydrodipicolinate reductase
MTLKIAIAGAAGRMGQMLTRLAATEDSMVVGASEHPASPALGKDPGSLAGVDPCGCAIAASPLEAAAGAEVWIDFTTPAAALAALDALSASPGSASGVRAVIIGATGFTPDQDSAIAVHARRIAIVKAGNFSLGVNLLLALVEQAAQRLGPDWDIEIFEAHHRHKTDAPSGTALMIGEAAASGRGRKLQDLRAQPWNSPSGAGGGARETGKIGFSVARMGGVVGDHEASFASESETLTLGHRALDRGVFARGALRAARWAVGRPPGLYSMRDVLSV